MTILSRPSESDRSGDPLVSVVVILFQAEQFIQAAIESVLAQSYRSWNLLLVDDGSTDGSTAIARCFAERYPEQAAAAGVNP